MNRDNYTLRFNGGRMSLEICVKRRERIKHWHTFIRGRFTEWWRKNNQTNKWVEIIIPYDLIDKEWVWKYHCRE